MKDFLTVFSQIAGMMMSMILLGCFLYLVSSFLWRKLSGLMYKSASAYMFMVFIITVIIVVTISAIASSVIVFLP